MVIYLLTFIISCLFIYIAEGVSNRSIIFGRFFLFLAILIPSILAGIRNLTIGTDVLNYVAPIYDAANSANSFYTFQNIPILNGILLVPISSFEIGFNALVYIITKIFGSLFFVLFFIQFLCISLTMFGLWSLRREFPVWLGMLTYYLCFFNTSLNLVRQSIAMSILIFGLRYLITNKWFKYVMVTICACLFHKTAIVGLIVLAVYYSLMHKKRKYISFSRNQKLIIITFIVGLIVLVPFVRNIFLQILGLSSYAQGYLTGDGSIAINQVILRIPILLLILIQWNHTKSSELKYFLLSMLICDIFTSQLSSFSESASRISLYFSYYYIYIFPYFTNDKSRLSKKILIILVIVYTLIYWYYSFVMMKYGQTVPYQISPSFNFK